MKSVKKTFNKGRNSNIELLRIISIIFIVVSHYSLHNGVSPATLPLGFNRFFLQIVTLGQMGNIIFVLITGYFLINDDTGFKLNKLLKMWLQVLFYSLFIYLIFVALRIEPFSIKHMISAMLPVTFSEYWFVSVYVLLYIFYPFINMLLNKINRKNHLKLIITSLMIFSVLCTFTMQSFYGNELIQFFMFYIIGAYFGKYKDNIFNKNVKLNYQIFIISSILLMLSVVCIDILFTHIPSLSSYPSTYFFRRSSVLAICFSVSLFNIFVNMKSFNNKYINTISSCVFGVYLISDNNYVRSVLWSNIFNNPAYVNSPFLPLHMLICVSLVFIICLIIEFIRKNTLEKLYNKFLSNKVNSLQKRISYRFDKLFSFEK